MLESCTCVAFVVSFLFLLLSSGLMEEVGAASGQDPKLTIRLFLVRHGETISNTEGRVSGQAESVSFSFC